MNTLVKSALLLALALVVPTLGVVTPAGTTIPGVEAAVRQSGATRLLPQIVQPGSGVAPANKAKLAGSVSFRPIRKGRPVTIQRRVGSGPWREVSTKRQNGAGVVEFRAAARNRSGRWYTYRGEARAWDGLRKKAARAQSAAIWNRTFSDEFTGSLLDLTKWSYRQVGLYSAGSNRACSASSPDAVKVKDGRVLLYVKADRERDLAGPCVEQNKLGETLENTHWYKNGHISTEHALNGSFRYGVAAARVKFDRQVGAHGSFWMQSTVQNRDGVGAAGDGAEIDVVEYFGNDFLHGDVYHFLHYTDAAGTYHRVPDGLLAGASKKARNALRRGQHWYDSYHVFSVQWSPKGYTFRVDGIRTRRITEGVSKVPEFLVLSMLSSGWEVDKLNRKSLPNATQVDWVRYWQR